MSVGKYYIPPQVCQTRSQWHPRWHDCQWGPPMYSFLLSMTNALSLINTLNYICMCLDIFATCCVLCVSKKKILHTVAVTPRQRYWLNMNQWNKSCINSTQKSQPIHCHECKRPHSVVKWTTCKFEIYDLDGWMLLPGTLLGSSLAWMLSSGVNTLSLSLHWGI